MKETRKKDGDPVLPYQSGRMMPVDPLGTNATLEERVRLRAYELYERRGKEEGYADDDWVRAEAEVKD